MKIYSEVYGCTANKSDASLILGILKQDKNEFVKDIDFADVLVIVTCTVIGTTEQRMLSRLREFKKTGKKVVVAGCMASIQSDLIKSILPDATLLPTQYSNYILNVIENKEFNFPSQGNKVGQKYFDGVSAPVSIAEGCLFACSYCITSPARGKLTSFSVDDIVKDVCYALNQNCREIQLTAQDTASYGLDTGNNLGDLLSKVCRINGDFRIRVGMMNPYTALMNLDLIIEGFKDSKIYKFLHLPVQSGDNDILYLMGRKYTVDDFIRIISEFKDKYPNLTLSTDIIVGFPGETDEQFNNSFDLLNTTKPDIVNVTRYSARPLTKAKGMKGRVPTKVAKERSKFLTELCSRIARNKNSEHVGQKYAVLVTKKGKNNTFVGRAENYKPVVINDRVNIREFIDVEIVDFDPVHLFGKLI
jgi:MiaB-like tRNA modifying enzyme